MFSHNYLYLNSHFKTRTFIVMILRGLPILLFIFIGSFHSFAQNHLESDSLEKLIENYSDFAKAETLNQFAKSKYKKEEYASALPYFKKALFLYIKEGNITEEIESYNLIGNCYLYLGEYDEAMNYCFKGLKLSEKTGSKENIAKSLNNVGNVHIYLGNSKEALNNYFLKSLEILKQIGNKLDISKSLNNIGITYGNMEKYSKALEFFEEALVIREEFGTQIEISGVVNNIGFIYMEIGNDELAIKNFRKAFNLSSKVDDKLGMALGFLNMAQFFYNKKEYNSALPHAKECLRFAEEIEAKGMEGEAYKILSNIYSELNQHKEALVYYKLFCEVNDSLFNEKSNNHIADIKIIYETKKKEAEIEVLNSENKLKGLKLVETKKWNTVLIVGILVVLLFSVIFFFQKVSLKRASKILVQKNLEIIASEKGNFSGSFSAKATIIKSSEIKYTGSAMNSDQEEELFNLIIDAFDNKKVYLQQDLSVTSLADKLKTNKTYVSQVINERFNQNFSTFINDYRIKEARRLLSEKENWNLTIEAIANNVGFKSKSAFNTAFKKFTGITPSYFLNSMND
ncbi:MAG: hypothetical protein COA97_09295 [Flavobacteriales bacterium]|nr:MAG: hypothetical protein COA97_09295 [Flavobacteriales bacterium]